MKLTIVGCAGSMSGPEAAASCYLVQAEGTDPDGGKERTWSVLIDMGPGGFGAAWRYLDPSNLDAVVLSHCHADHMADVISLHVHHRWHPEGRITGLPIYGPADTRRRFLEIDGYADPDAYADVFDFRTVTSGMQFSVGPLHFEAFPGNHTVESYGFRITGPGAQGGQVLLAYTGDTDDAETIDTMAHGVDLLLCECGFTAADKPRGIHLDGRRAGALASRAEVGELVLTHIQPWTDPAQVEAEVSTTWAGPLKLAAAGQEYLL